MTTLQRTNPNAPAMPPTDWSQWVRVDLAASMLGVGRLHLARVCLHELHGRGLAKKVKAPGDTRVAWWINRAHDPRLARPINAAPIPTLEDQGVAMDKASAARQRRECVRLFRRWRAERKEKQALWMPRLLEHLGREYPGIKINRSGLCRWDKLLRDDDRDLIELVDTRGGRGVSVSPQAWAYFEVEYLQSSAPAAAECWRLTKLYAQDHGLSWCSLRTCQAQLAERIPPAKAAFHRDRDRFNSEFLPTMEQDPEAHAAGRYWVADHSILDFQCTHQGRVFRPELTTFQDWRTRKIVGWCLAQKGNSDTILLALREGLLDPANMGGPTEVGFDNGKDFDSLIFDGRSKTDRKRERSGDFALGQGEFRGILGELNITPHFSLPYGPNGKSRQERFYGTLHAWMCKRTPSYVGKDPVSRPHDQVQKVKRDGMPSFAEARERVKEFVRAYNNRADHAIEDLHDDGVKLSPNQAMAAWCREQRVFNDGALDLLLLHHDRPVTVTKQGVRITIAGQVYRYGLMQPELLPYQGTRRKVRPAYDPRDVSAIKVFDNETNRLICVAKINDRGGHRDAIGREKLSAHHRKVREHTNTLKKVGLDGMIPAAASSMELKMRRDELPAAPEPVTDSIAPVSTRFDGQDNQRQRAELKAAAGAESDAHPRNIEDAVRNRPRSKGDILAELDAEAIDQEPGDTGPLAHIGDLMNAQDDTASIGEPALDEPGGPIDIFDVFDDLEVDA